MAAASCSGGSHRLSSVSVAIDDPLAADVGALLAAHLAFAHGATPRAFSFAVEAERLVDPSVTFFSARGEGVLLGVAALKRLEDSHAELKSMHVLASERGRGVGRALVDHMLRFAASAGYARVSLETGTGDAFSPARTLYQRWVDALRGLRQLRCERI